MRFPALSEEQPASRVDSHTTLSISSVEGRIAAYEVFAHPAALTGLQLPS